MTDQSSARDDDPDLARRRGRLGIVALLGGLTAVGAGVWWASGSTAQSSTPVVFQTVQIAAPVTPPGGGNLPSTSVATTDSAAVEAPVPVTVAPETASTSLDPATTVTADTANPLVDGSVPVVVDASTTTLPSGESTLVSLPTTAASAPTTMAAVSLGGPSSTGTAAAYSVIEGGTMYLRGAVPDEATATRVTNELSFRKGGQVINELTIDPSASQPTTIPLFVPTAALFTANGAELLDGIGPTLDVVSSLLRNTESTKLLIRGHTDDQGSEAYNFALSQQRVAAVLAYLVRSGVDAGRLVVEPRGEIEPIADNATSEGRARNRRVELVLVAA